MVASGGGSGLNEIVAVFAANMARSTEDAESPVSLFESDSGHFGFAVLVVVLKFGSNLNKLCGIKIPNQECERPDREEQSAIFPPAVSPKIVV